MAASARRPRYGLGIGLMLVFGELRLLGSLGPVAVALCVINLPFMIWAVSASANRLDPDLENAASSCGARCRAGPDSARSWWTR